jgi:predicted nucleic acid-binding protein
MPDSVFFDTNVVLYLLSKDENKANTVESLLSSGGVISVQVLNELVNVTRRKLAMDWPDINELVESVARICTVNPLTIETHHKGRLLAERYQLSTYDAMIVASALETNCRLLYSEDMHNELVIENMLTIRNPFKVEDT